MELRFQKLIQLDQSLFDIGGLLDYPGCDFLIIFIHSLVHHLSYVKSSMQVGKEGFLEGVKDHHSSLWSVA